MQIGCQRDVMTSILSNHIHEWSNTGFHILQVQLQKKKKKIVCSWKIIYIFLHSYFYIQNLFNDNIFLHFVN